MKWRVLILSNLLRQVGKCNWLKRYVEKTAIFALAVIGSNRFSYVSQLGSVDAVIDVGVYEGTPDLYDQFPNSHFILVDPLTTVL